MLGKCAFFVATDALAATRDQVEFAFLVDEQSTPIRVGVGTDKSGCAFTIARSVGDAAKEGWHVRHFFTQSYEHLVTDCRLQDETLAARDVLLHIHRRRNLWQRRFAR